LSDSPPIDLQRGLAALFGTPAAVRVDRARTELRHGRPVRLQCGDAPALVLAALETLETAPDAAWLLLTRERAAALGLPADAPALALAPPPGTPMTALLGAAGLAADDDLGRTAAPPWPRCTPADTATAAAWAAALQLAKWARLTPALLAWPAPAADRDDPLLSVAVADITAQLGRPGAPLRRVSEATIPLDARDGRPAETCRLVLFRETDSATEHVAVVYGTPDPAAAVTVRLHSSCFTGDLLGSLRCDCGEQLLRATGQLRASGGVLLYLAQEGRGTGLASKLRAYRLQDQGLDTLDADRHLGFRGDERDFRPAAAMLRSLGIGSVRLLTNNPRKIDALRAAGVEVVDRIPLVAPANAHNARYLRTKRQRAGHLGPVEGDD
jgi:GTP cyclohydrolase II